MQQCFTEITFSTDWIVKVILLLWRPSQHCTDSIRKYSHTFCRPGRRRILVYFIQADASTSIGILSLRPILTNPKMMTPSSGFRTVCGTCRIMDSRRLEDVWQVEAHLGFITSKMERAEGFSRRVFCEVLSTYPYPTLTLPIVSRNWASLHNRASVYKVSQLIISHLRIHPYSIHHPNGEYEITRSIVIGCIAITILYILILPFSVIAREWCVTIFNKTAMLLFHHWKFYVWWRNKVNQLSYRLLSNRSPVMSQNSIIRRFATSFHCCCWLVMLNRTIENSSTADQHDEYHNCIT